MSSWETEVAAKTKVYKEHQSRFCTLLLMSAQLVDRGATAGITVEDANKRDCMKYLARLIADSPSNIELPAELFRVLRSTIEKRRAACDWFLARAPEDEVTRNHLDFIGVLEGIEQRLIAKSRFDATRALALSTSASVQAQMTDMNHYKILGVPEPSTPSEEASSEFELESSSPPESLSSGIQRSKSRSSVKTRQTTLFGDRTGISESDFARIHEEWVITGVGVPFRRPDASKRLLPSYWELSSKSESEAPPVWPRSTLLVPRTGWQVPVYASAEWMPPNATDFMAAMYVADKLDAEEILQDASDSEGEKMHSASYECMDLYNSRKYKRYRAARRIVEGLDDDSTTSSYEGSAASSHHGFQVPDHLRLRDFAHTYSPPSMHWPDDFSETDEELKDEELDFEATWKKWDPEDNEAGSVDEHGGVETDRGRSLVLGVAAFLLQAAQRVDFAATKDLTFGDACTPKQMKALALLVADAASPFPVPIGLLRALSDTIAMRRSVYQRHSATFASEESKARHLRFIVSLEKVQHILESKAMPASNLAPSLSHPQGALSGSSPGFKNRSVASHNGRGLMPVPGTREGTDTSSRRSSKPLRKSRTKTPSKLSFAALLEIGQRVNMSTRASSATLVAQPALGALAIAEDWQGPIDWGAGREELLQPSTPQRTSASGTDGWPSPDHPFYFDPCPRVPGSVFPSV
ncbi:hypothetical protein B0A48_12197 [Cryoendolithus antarcticus]|uniref:DUF6604 domain-containing protein n=1 Tax=Cryoendolithus antarcticus TaxID=1507870 RepID=A0A1V8SUJ2_9PEZI|nr:hypothetical protein B0A48_12197 [Cryoendolithus antarcticus]